VSGFAVLHSTAEWVECFGPSAKRTVVSIGNFDGLHLGHQKILHGVVARAGVSGCAAAVVTFDPHPVKVLRPAQAPQMLQTLQQRLAGFAAFGLDAALVLRFDAALAARPAEEFVSDILVHPLRTSAILVGATFRFGYRQAGNVALLEELGRRFDFAVEIVEPVACDGVVISSTAIRHAVAEGRVAEAARLLGRPFALTGQVERGAGRGGTVLVPTLNLSPEQELVPGNGVYATETFVGGKLYRSATNIGVRPTFDGTRRSIESHLFDFSEQLTAGPLEVRFWKRLRDERKFDNPEELLRQIAVDLDQAREFFRHMDLSPTNTRRC
jgi:riboflavin kinase / FMN adenylyltransferase